MMWWRESTISVCAFWRFVDVLQRGRATAPSSLLTPNTALRRVLLYTGGIKPSVVSGGSVSSYYLAQSSELCFYVNFLWEYSANVTFSQKSLYQNFFTGLFSLFWSCPLFQETFTNYKIKYLEKLNCFAFTHLCHQRSSVQGAKFIKNVVVPVGTRVQMAWTVMMQSMELV